MHVVLHVPYGADLRLLGIESFKKRFPEFSVVALVSSSLPHEHLDEIAGLADATVPDDRSLETLARILKVIQEGFSIVPSKIRKPETDDTARVDPLSGTTAPRGYSTESLSQSSPLFCESSPKPELGERPNPIGSAQIALAKLSAREKEVLRQVRDGKSNKDIAKMLDIVESTVKVHLRGCFRKIGAHNRTQAAVWATQNFPD